MPNRFEARDRAVRPQAGLALAVLVAGCADGTGPTGLECDGLDRGSSGAAIGLSIEPGETCALLAADAANLEIEPSADRAEYLIAVVSTSEVPGATTSLRFEVEGVQPAAAASRTARASAPAASLAALDEEWASRAELRLRANAREALRDARPLRLPEAAGSIRRSAAAGGLAPGDTIVFQNSVDADLGVDCDGIHEIVAVVRALGPNFGVVEDVEAAGAVTAAEHADVLQALESLVFPVDTAYFGSPADLDANGVVWLLFTPVVNRVTPRGAEARVTGFFNPSDLSDPASCPASNRGEILYVLAADPSGRFSDPVDPEFATSRAIGVAAHELEHLISAQRRVTLGGGTFADLEDAWLGEGLAHSAETAVGLMAAGLTPGANLDYTRLVRDVDSFNAYFFANFRRAGFYFLDTNGTLALGDADGGDPGGISSLEMRGFAWLLLRWVADRYATGVGGLLGGPADERLFRDLASGGPDRARGIANLERASASLGGPQRWEELLTGYALAPLADDIPGQPTASSQIETFALRSAFAGLNQDVGDTDPFRQRYPLLVTEIALSPSTNAQTNFDLKSAASRYFVLGSETGHPAIRLALGTPGGGAVPGSAGARVVVMRTR